MLGGGGGGGSGAVVVVVVSAVGSQCLCALMVVPMVLIFGVEVDVAGTCLRFWWCCWCLCRRYIGVRVAVAAVDDEDGDSHTLTRWYIAHGQILASPWSHRRHNNAVRRGVRRHHRDE